MASVEYRQDSGAGIVTLSRSASGNRLNLQSLKELEAALRRAINDSSVRILILRSNGPVFSLGLDLTAVAETKSGNVSVQDTIAEAVGLYRSVLFTLFSCDKPVISIVQGEVKAGGVGLVCASDIVLATDGASVELSEVIFGLIPANVLPYLLQTRITLSKARYLILSARRCSAEEAVRFGIFDEVFPEDTVERGVKKICKQLFRSSPEALARTKEFTLKLLEAPFLTRQEMAEKEMVELLGRETVREEISKFQEGELPSWFASFSPEKPLCIVPEE